MGEGHSVYWECSLILAFGLLLPALASAQDWCCVADGYRNRRVGRCGPGRDRDVTNQATNETFEDAAVSNDAGLYTVTSLPVGTYVVKAELSRFKTAATKPLAMEAKQVVRLDFKLELGAVEETVEVKSDTPVDADGDRDRRLGHFRDDTGAPCRYGCNTGQLLAPAARVSFREPQLVHRRSEYWSGGRPHVTDAEAHEKTTRSTAWT